MALSAEDRYRTLLEFAGKERERWRNSKVIMRKEDLKFERSRQGMTAQVVNPALGFNVHAISSFIRESPPGKKGGKHRHRMEAIIHILSGRGYSIIDDRKTEWNEGDTLCIPMWSTHQHRPREACPALRCHKHSIDDEPRCPRLGTARGRRSLNADSVRREESYF